MVNRKCKECGKLMTFKLAADARQFCSKACFYANRKKQLNAPGNGPAMPPLKAEDITDDGYIAIVKAIVSRASRDVTNFKPGTQARIQAEKFFESEYFNVLTGLDGQAVLSGLRKIKTGKARDVERQGGGIPQPVQCVETGEVYASIEDASRAYGIHPSCIQKVVAKNRNRAAGMHWKRVEG